MKRGGLHDARKKDAELNRFWIRVEQAANDVIRKAAALEEARALRFLFAGGCRFAVFAREDRLCFLEITLG